MLVILAGSSGSGKNTIIREIIKKFPKVKIMKSCTTRNPRNEEEKKAYYFLSEEDFKKKLQNNEFFETEEVHKGLFYGTLKKEIKKVKGSDIYMKDIDVNGARKLKQELNEDIKLVYLDVPKEILRERIIKRGESEESADLRLSRYDYEKSFIPEYDLVIKNKDLNSTIEEIINFLDLKN